MVSEEASRLSFQIRTRSASLRGSSSFERDRRVFPRRPSLPRPSPGLAAEGHELAAQVSPRRERQVMRATRSDACRGPRPLCPAFPPHAVRKPPTGHPPEDARVSTSPITATAHAPACRGPSRSALLVRSVRGPRLPPLRLEASAPLLPNLVSSPAGLRFAAAFLGDRLRRAFEA